MLAVVLKPEEVATVVAVSSASGNVRNCCKMLHKTAESFTGLTFSVEFVFIFFFFFAYHHYNNRFDYNHRLQPEISNDYSKR